MSSSTFWVHLFLLFYGFYKYVRSFVIIPQVSVTLFIFFFQSIFLFRLDNFSSVFQITDFFFLVPSNLLAGPPLELLFQLLYFPVLKFPLGSYLFRFSVSLLRLSVFFSFVLSVFKYVCNCLFFKSMLLSNLWQVILTSVSSQCWFLLIVFFTLRSFWFLAWHIVFNWNLDFFIQCSETWISYKLHIFLGFLCHCSGRGWGGIILLLLGGTRSPDSLLGLFLTIQGELLYFWVEKSKFQLPTWSLPVTMVGMVSLLLGYGESSDPPLGLLWHHPIEQRAACFVTRDGSLSSFSHPLILRMAGVGAGPYWLIQLKPRPSLLPSLTPLAEVLGISLLPQERGNLGSPLAFADMFRDRVKVFLVVLGWIRVIVL